MRNDKIIKLIVAILIIFVTLASFNNIIYAVVGVEDNPDFYNPTKDGNNSESKLKTKIKTIVGYINLVGVIISVVTLTIIGIRYMVGSVDEKAEYKKTMIIYIIGAILIFSVTTIPNILYKIGTSIN